MDGLQVLKGGTAKATVYFDTKDATKAALDLNEQEITIGLPDVPAAVEPESIEDIEHRMTAALAEAAVCHNKMKALALSAVQLLVERPIAEHPLFVHPVAGDFPGHASAQKEE
jgi:hypothetical protein